MSDKRTPLSPPMSQNVMAGRASSGSAMYLRKLVPAENTAEMTIPASTSPRIASLRIAREMNHAAVTARIPTASARDWITTTPAPSVSARAAPNPAPDDAPRISGETRGLRKTCWYTAPANDRDSPISIATTRRGKRILEMTWETSSAPVQPPVSSAHAYSTRVPGPIGYLPKLKESMNTTISPIAIAIIAIVARRRRRRWSATALDRS